MSRRGGLQNRIDYEEWYTSKSSQSYPFAHIFLSGPRTVAKAVWAAQ